MPRLRHCLRGDVFQIVLSRRFKQRYEGDDFKLYRALRSINPETSDERIRFIDDNTDGFIYMVSSAATTGAQKEFDDTKQRYFSRINSMQLHHPRMIGFGISNKQTLNSANANASGAIIGSKFVTLLEETGNAATAMDKLYDALKQ